MVIIYVTCLTVLCFYLLWALVSLNNTYTHDISELEGNLRRKKEELKREIEAHEKLRLNYERIQDILERKLDV